MITGDNPLTAVSVARECSLINQAAHVFTPMFSRGLDSFFVLIKVLLLILTFSIGNATIPTSRLVWSSMDDPLWKLDSYSLKPMTPPPYHTMESEEINYQDYSLVVTGDVFRWMLNYAPLETVQRVCINVCRMHV
jgi:cation-transporting ATPase 13A3/4/5